MADQVIVYGFETSNNIKVRIALWYKEIPYQFETIDPQDRSEIIRLSGQPFTPILVHGDRVLFDSAAILRYLEANFRDSTPLFSDDYQTMREIEAWEGFARRELALPMLTVLRSRLAGTLESSIVEKATTLFSETSELLDERLAEQDWLLGESMTAADVTAAPVVYRSFEGGLLEPLERPGTYRRLGEPRDGVRSPPGPVGARPHLALLSPLTDSAIPAYVSQNAPDRRGFEVSCSALPAG